MFVFNTATSNVDTVVDFKTAEGDKIHLKYDIFWLGSDRVGQALMDVQFFVGAPADAPSSFTRIIYQKATAARLFFDQDGSGTRFAPKQIATFSLERPNLTKNDFLIIS